MITGVLLAAESAARGGQLWRPLLIFGVIAVLMALVVVVQVTDPRRRSRDEEHLDTDPQAVTPQATPRVSDPVIDGAATEPEEPGPAT